MTAAVAIPEADGAYPDIDTDAYHADRGSLSVSGAKLLLPPSCPAKFKDYIDNPQPPKRIYDFGHLAHYIVLGEGERFAVLDPAVHGLKKDGTPADSPRATAGWKAAEAEARENGLIPVSLDDWSVAEAMAEKVAERNLFHSGTAEVALYHTDPATGVRLRGRCDWITNDGALIFDYKTAVTANPAELERRFWALGYHMQAQWYRSLVIGRGLHPNPQFVFVVQEKKPPYVVTVAEYDEEAMFEAARLNRQAIDTYVQCTRSGEWPAYTSGKVTISLPRFALRDGIQAAADNLIAELEGIYQE